MHSKFVSVASGLLIWFSAFSFLMVGCMAFINPQSVMDLVNVQLTSPDAYSSIRGVYGGVGISLFISLLYLSKHYKPMALGLLTLIWGFYALSRSVTIFMEGALGSFGKTWFLLESFLFIFCLVLWMLTFSMKRIVTKGVV